MRQFETTEHDALQCTSTVAGSDDSFWPLWIVDVAESEHQDGDLVSTIDVIDSGTVLTWQIIAQPMLAALGADYTGLSLHLAPQPIRDDVRRVCLTAAHSRASAALSISWPPSASNSTQHLIAWTSPSEAERGLLEIHLIILPTHKSSTPSLCAVPSAGVFAGVTQNRS